MDSDGCPSLILRKQCRHSHRCICFSSQYIVLRIVHSLLLQNSRHCSHPQTWKFEYPSKIFLSHCSSSLSFTVIQHLSIPMVFSMTCISLSTNLMGSLWIWLLLGILNHHKLGYIRKTCPIHFLRFFVHFPL